jgi:cell division protein FtsI (penicillin-binding protein 3)
MGSSPSPVPSRRLLYLAGFLLFWALIVAGRLVQLQVLRYGEFHERAQKQQQRTFEVSPSRGIIYDRNGRELAMSVNVDSVFAVPTEIPDQPATAALLGKVTGEDQQAILARMKASRLFAWIARKPDSETINRIRALNLKGIYFQKEPKRFYPKRELGAQFLGYVGMDDYGLSGIERQFDAELHGIPGKMSIQRDARGHYFGSVEQPPSAGENLVLTIDEKIQYIAERELEQAMAETHAIAGTVVVEDPRTGEILALANRPNFNPNNTRHITPAQLNDRAVSDIYEPGSTFKVVTVAAALEENVTRPDEQFDCQMGSIVVAGMRIRDSKPHGLLDVTHVIAESSDVGAIKIGMRLGEQRFDQYVRSFGFGSQSGIELPAETRGLYKPIARWSKVSMAAMSMGQEIGITPVQLAGLISTIANDGVYVAPRIVAADVPGARLGNGVNARFQSVSLQPTAAHRVISPKTAGEMKTMLRAVVLEGTGLRAQLEGYSSAGKTGTAQKVDPATGAYSKTKWVASFAGFAPIDHPAIVVAVILDSAVGLHQGGQVAAPVFHRVAQQVLTYLNVSHDLDLKKPKLMRASLNDDALSEGSTDRLVEAPSENSNDFAAVEQQLKSTAPSQLQPVATQRRSRGTTIVCGPARSEAECRVGSEAKNSPVGTIETAVVPSSPSQGGTDPLPASNRGVVAPNGAAVIDISGGQIVPSFIGKPLRSVVEVAEQSGVEVEVIGSGVAREQSPAPGARVMAGQKVIVRFAR